MTNMVEMKELFEKFGQVAPAVEEHCTDEVYETVLEAFVKANPQFPEQHPRQWWALQQLPTGQRFHYVYQITTQGQFDPATLNTLWVKASQIEISQRDSIAQL